MITLNAWLTREKISDAEFGRRIGRSRMTVGRFRKGERVPDRETMTRIVRETRGEVQPGDFFEVEQADAEAPSGRKRRKAAA